MRTVNSYAKINLTLDILRKLDSGYHEINSVMQTISLHDTMSFKESAAVIVKCLGVEQEKNIVYRTAMLLKEKYGIRDGIEIIIDKEIPVGAGLGGGSSNAATTLIELNRLWELGLSQNQLEELAVQLGMDVAFFLYGGTCFAYNKGEKAMKIRDLHYLDILLVYPNINISTREAYSSIDYSLIGKRQSSERLLSYLEKNTFDSSILHNDFEYSILKQYPVLAEIKHKLIANGAANALMSGSGSVVYGVFDEIDKLENARGLFKEFITIRSSTLNP